MIPLRLFISGFLSYQDPVEVDFTNLELACISGSNGAGKSSLLDAITWVLFGEARTRDDEALINGSPACKSAEVVFDFHYETNIFRVQRSKTRKKATVLEFFVQAPDGSWRVLTEKTVRDTENRLRQTLRLDYDTFVNASFFLQGKADQFAQQNPTQRKKVLSSILGLEIWETYKEKAVEQRRTVEVDLKALDAQLADIDNELSEEQVRKDRLKDIEARLNQLSTLRQAKELSLDTLRRLAASLGEQKRLLDVFANRLGDTRKRVERLERQREELQTEQGRLRERLAAAGEIEEGYRRWLAVRQDLEHWDTVAASFHEIQTRRAGPLAEIAAARSQLEEEKRGLAQKAEAERLDRERLCALEAELPGVALAIQAAQGRLAQRAELEVSVRSVQQLAADQDAENRRLRGEMNALKERIERLRQAGGAVCPLCGQPLSPEDRESLVASLETEGRQMGDVYRSNQKAIEQSSTQLRDLQVQIVGLARSEDELRLHTRRHDQLESETVRLKGTLLIWASEGHLRLEAVDLQLADEAYAPQARARLAEINAAARDLGYDAAAHDGVRKAEQDCRIFEQGLRDLESARAALGPLDRQIEGIGLQLASELTQFQAQESEYQAADLKYQAESANLPDIEQAEREARSLQLDENRLRTEMGMAFQRVAVLDTLRERKTRFAEQRTGYTRQISRLKVLEKAFGKDGVPAVLIEHALPEIQEHANDILDRLTAGSMSVRFETQRTLKSKEEMRETLDILISDSSGQREYEMFSGGEAFRVNFAIRLALSRVLAHRAGARLQTLFIDEGFGSQDADGRQRLLEAINQVRSEFARILVITHLEEMKDAFPSRIEVEKTPHGSRVRVTV